MVIYPPHVSAFAFPAVVVSSIRKPVSALFFPLPAEVRIVVLFLSFPLTFSLFAVLYILTSFFVSFPLRSLPDLSRPRSLLYLCCVRTYLIPGDGAHTGNKIHQIVERLPIRMRVLLRCSRDIRESKLKISWGRVEVNELFTR